jgi:hypothetical protein
MFQGFMMDWSESRDYWRLLAPRLGSALAVSFGGAYFAVSKLFVLGFG